MFMCCLLPCEYAEICSRLCAEATNCAAWTLHTDTWQCHPKKEVKGGRIGQKYGKLVKSIRHSQKGIHI